MSTLKTNTLQNAAGTKSVPMDTVVDGTAKAWVNFNGTGTVAIRASFNVTSITDNGTGDYTVNLTNALADANYCLSGTGEGNSANPGSNIGMISKRGDTAFTSSACRILCGEAGSASAVPRDMSVVSVAIFR